MSDLFPITLAEEIAAVEREVKLRKRVYPRYVHTRRMTQEKADKEIFAMEAVLRRLKEIERHVPERPTTSPQGLGSWRDDCSGG